MAMISGVLESIPVSKVSAQFHFEACSNNQIAIDDGSLLPNLIARDSTASNMVSMNG